MGNLAAFQSRTPGPIKSSVGLFLFFTSNLLVLRSGRKLKASCVNNEKLANNDGAGVGVKKIFLEKRRNRWNCCYFSYIVSLFARHSCFSRSRRKIAEKWVYFMQIFNSPTRSSSTYMKFLSQLCKWHIFPLFSVIHRTFNQILQIVLFIINFQLCNFF